MNKIDTSKIQKRTPKKRKTSPIITEPEQKVNEELLENSSFKPEMKTSHFQTKKTNSKTKKEETGYTSINNQGIYQTTMKNNSTSKNYFTALGAFTKVQLFLDVNEDGTLIYEGKEIQNKDMVGLITKVLDVKETQATNLIKNMLKYRLILKKDSIERDNKGEIVLVKKTKKPKKITVYVMNKELFEKGSLNTGLKNLAKLNETKAKTDFLNIDYQTVGFLISLVPFFNKQTFMATTIEEADKDLISEEEVIKLVNEEFMEKLGANSLKEAFEGKSEEEMGEILRLYREINDGKLTEIFEERFENFYFSNESMLASELNVTRKTLNNHANILREKNILLVYKGQDGNNRYIINPKILSKFYDEKDLLIMNSYVKYLDLLFENNKNKKKNKKRSK